MINANVLDLLIRGQRFEALLAAEPGQLASRLRQLKESSEAAIANQIEAARCLVEEHYSWNGIAARFAQELKHRKLI